MKMTPKQVIESQKYVLAAKRACLLISLGIMCDQFNATDTQLKNAIVFYENEMKNYHAWSSEDVKRAYADLKAVAKTYNGARLETDTRRVGFRPDVNQMIWNAEAVGFFTMLRLLRTAFGATYKQLDFFCERYDEFNKLYKEGDQISMLQLNHELYQITGRDILQSEVKKK